MASKTISITEDVYILLSKLKLPNESFGDVIKRICSEKLSSQLSPWIEDKALWSDMDDEEYREFKKSLKDRKYTMNEVQLP